MRLFLMINKKYNIHIIIYMNIFKKLGNPQNIFKNLSNPQNIFKKVGSFVSTLPSFENIKNGAKSIANEIQKRLILIHLMQLV